MSKPKTKGPTLAKGKAKVSYALPEKLIERIGVKAARERSRPSHVAERLLLKGLEAENKQTPEPVSA